MATPSALFDVPLQFFKDREILSRNRETVAITLKRDKRVHISTNLFLFFFFCAPLVKWIPRVMKRPIY